MKHQWAPVGYAFAALSWVANAGIHVALLRPGFVFDPDTMGTWAALEPYELANGNGYATGGIALTGKTQTYVPASDLWNLDADDVQWGQVGGPFASFDAAAAAVYDSNNGYLWSFIDFEGAKAVLNGVFALQFDPAGVLYAQALAPV